MGLIVAGVSFGTLMLTWMMAPLLGTGVLDMWGLAWMVTDRYYCLLIPLTVPITIVGVSLNWLSLKLFKHKS